MSNTINLTVNESVSVTTLILDGYGIATTAQTINYLSSDPTIITLANSGVFVPGSIPQNSVSTNVIKGLKNGTATITITINGGTVIDTINVVVNSPAPASLSFIFGTPIPA